MKKKMIFVGLMLALMIISGGCGMNGSNSGDKSAETVTVSFSESKEEKSESEITASTAVPEPDTEQAADEVKTTTAVSKTKKTKATTTEKKYKPTATPTKKTTEVTKPPKTTKPAENKPSTTTPTTSVKQNFDIGYWINFSKNYAASIGLKLDKTATACWDTPISANANRKNLESDIKSRLNRYKNVEGFTYVWIWAEKISENEYDLFIGYA